MLTPYFWSLHSGGELDLLFHLDGRAYGVEFKYSEAPRAGRSMHSAIDELGLERLFVVYPGSARFPIHEKIEAIPLSGILDELKAM